MNEAELLFSEILKCDRTSLYLNSKNILDKDRSEKISLALRKRINGEPLQYILGNTEFMGFEFKVGPEVLIPRPETEILVETVTKLLTAHSSQLTAPRILDIGTGSGCIAISLVKLLPNIRITAIDISEKAIGIAKENAILNNVREQINFVKSDLFPKFEARPTKYDIIVSNPPYIPADEINKLHPEVRCEPRIALDGGEDGLNFYRKIISSAPEYLVKEGLLIMEMGFGQRARIENMIKKSKNFEIIEVVKDYSNIDRVVVARKAN